MVLFFGVDCFCHVVGRVVSGCIVLPAESSRHGGLEWRQVYSQRLRCGSASYVSGWHVLGQVGVSGDYVLVLSGGLVYRDLVSLASRYVARLFGVGSFVVLDERLNVLFGVRLNGVEFLVLCGSASVRLGSFCLF